MKACLRLVAILTLICLVCTALLSAVHNITSGPIEDARRAREERAIRNVLPPGMTNFVAVATDTATHFVVRDANGALAAAAVKGHSAHGYGGDIALLVGFTAEGTLHNFEVLAASETPGLGARIASDTFKANIRGRPAETRWIVRKDGGEIDAISAATISSRAAMEAIRDATTQFMILRETLQKGTHATP
jgi:Na+-translocating ferredoxin:NAD+ oxidoreductase subunit G